MLQNGEIPKRVSEENRLIHEIRTKVEKGEITITHLSWFSQLKVPELNFLAKWWLDRKK